MTMEAGCPHAGQAGGAPAPAARPRLVRGLCSVFIALNLWAIAASALPVRGRLWAGLNRACIAYADFTGLWQGWNLFAPNPRSSNVYLQARIVYRNGDTRVWDFYRPQQYGVLRRAWKERYRKWANDNIRLDGNASEWPYVARYIARQANDRRADPPRTVELVRYWSQIAPPSPGPGGSEGAAAWNRFVFYRYRVEPGDL